MSKELKAEWWELWWVKPGKKPEFVKMYGRTITDWVPDGCFPSRELALKTKRALRNRYYKVFHIRRFRKLK